jgi:hypothetical protein
LGWVNITGVLKEFGHLGPLNFTGAHLTDNIMMDPMEGRREGG